MVILSSKTINILKTQNTYWVKDEVASWLNSINTGNNDCRLVMHLEITGKQKKKTAKAVLKDLAISASAERKDAWRQGNYEFCFLSQLYFWKGEEIHLTPGEQLFLFKWLVLKDGTGKYCKHFLRNMRRRLGEDFLADVGITGEFQ